MSQNKECNELIGEIAAAFLKKQIAIVEGQQTFRFDGLEDETLTACVNAIWNDPRLRESVFFKIPRDLLKAEDAASPGIIFEGTIICQNNFRHSFSLTWSGKTCDIRRSL